MLKNSVPEWRLAMKKSPAATKRFLRKQIKNISKEISRLKSPGSIFPRIIKNIVFLTPLKLEGKEKGVVTHKTQKPVAINKISTNITSRDVKITSIKIGFCEQLAGDPLPGTLLNSANAMNPTVTLIAEAGMEITIQYENDSKETIEINTTITTCGEEDDNSYNERRKGLIRYEQGKRANFRAELKLLLKSRR